MFCDFSLSFVYYLRVFRGFMGLFRVLSSFLLFSVLYVLFKKRAGVVPRVFKPDNTGLRIFLTASTYLIKINSFLPLYLDLGLFLSKS